MKLAITSWNHRIAPVFDSARTALVLDVQGAECCPEAPIDLAPCDLSDRARSLTERGIEELICGAISCEAERLVSNGGIRVHPFIAGDIPTVIQAWLQDGLNREEFSMPGCRRGNRAGRRGRERGRCRGISSDLPQD